MHELKLRCILGYLGCNRCEFADSASLRSNCSLFNSSDYSLINTSSDVSDIVAATVLKTEMLAVWC